MDKPFITLDAQLELLESRGLIIDAGAREHLARESYYQVINGYKDPFLVSDDRFEPGTRYSHIASVFEFDRKLRMAMLSDCARAEASLKTICSYELEESFSPSPAPYLDERAYTNARRLKNQVSRCIKTFEDAIIGKHPFDRQPYLSHYRQTMDRIPTWVLMNALNFGDVLRFARCANQKLQNRIAKRFSELHCLDTGESLQLSLRGPHSLLTLFNRIKDVRNLCAHDERLYCVRVGKPAVKPICDVLDDLALVVRPTDHTQTLRYMTALLDELKQAIPAPAFAYVLNSMR